jgi:hypothetical protein
MVEVQLLVGARELVEAGTWPRFQRNRHLEVGEAVGFPKDEVEEFLPEAGHWPRIGSVEATS